MRVISFVATAAALMAVAAEPLSAADAPRLSGPYVHENLAVFLVHGTSAAGPVPLTLQEALVAKKIQVIETKNVNELKIENTSGEEVFIQAGDIVKGGQQDRVLTLSMLLPPRSGQVPIAAFCVEQGRWAARGKEDVRYFSSAAESLPSREAKLAMRAPALVAPTPSPMAATATAPMPPPLPQSDGRIQARLRQSVGADPAGGQSAVWAEVARMQEKLSGSLRAAVASPLSATSLQLSLENDKVQKARQGYVAALAGRGTAQPDVVGYVLAVNGRLNSADIYPSNGLFRKMWDKQLTAAATEAVGERGGALAATVPGTDAVLAFLARAESGKADEREIAAIMRQDVRDTREAIYVEAKRRNGAWVHRAYLAK